MKLSLLRSFPLTYRKEAVSSFIFLMAMTEIIVGGMNQSGTLLSFGGLMIILAIYCRWLQVKKTRRPLFYYSPSKRVPKRYTRTKSYPVSYYQPTPLPRLKRKRDYR